MESARRIPTLAQECSSILSKLPALGLQFFADEDKSKVLIDDICGRFHVWAANIAALQPLESRKSLAFRLRYAPLMQSGIISGLERLKRCHAKISNILAGDRWNRRSEEEEQSSPQIEGEWEGDKTPFAELDELLLNISSTLDHLFGLSILIRRMRPKGKARNFEQVPEDPRDVITVIDKFPKLRQQNWLAKRLGIATGQRKQYFTYRQEHRRRLTSRKHVDHVFSGDETSGVDAATTIATTFEEDVIGEASSASIAEPTFDRTSIFTSATSFVSDYDDNQEMGRRVPDLPDMILDKAQLEYGVPSECPYCRTIQIFRNRLEWKRHVFSDLQPYVCTFEHCDEGLFSTRHEWLQHELNAHRRRWQCIQCDNSNSEFSSEDEMTRHLKQRHGDAVTDNQIAIVLKGCERPITVFDSSACVFCAEWNPLPAEGSNAKQFFQHLARHQQQIALEALPLYIEGLEVREEKSSEASDGSDTGSEGQTEDEQPHAPLTDAPSALFGVPLQELYDRDGLAVPMIVYQCIQAVDLYGLTAEDIYQKRGEPGRIQTLRRLFESDSHSRLSDFREQENFFHDVHTVTGLLKSFFLSLPEPLMPDENFIIAARHDDPIVRRDSLHALVNALPDPNYAILRAMILHFKRIIESVHWNRMNAQNLASIFGPIFITGKENNPNIRLSTVDLTVDSYWEMKAIATILEGALDIFDEED